MKAILTLFLVLISAKSMAMPGGEVYSRVCNYSQVQGVKIKNPAGLVLTACLSPSRIQDEYLTAVDTNCMNDFVEGVIIQHEGGFAAKICLRRSSIGDIYETASAHECAYGYGADQTVEINDDFSFHPSKYCVRGRGKDGRMPPYRIDS